MSFVSKGISALGNLVLIGLLLLCFGVGLAGVVYFSLSGREISVPDIVGKDFVESEKELAALGLKIKRRADRPSSEKINTVLEQLPKPGETVKTGQMILVVVSKAGAEGEETPPPSLQNNINEDDSEKIEDMISDKPKKAKPNSNTNKKKAETTRDVIANTSTSDDNSAPSVEKGTDKEKKTAEPDDNKKGTEKKEKNDTKPTGNQGAPKPPAGKNPQRRK